MGPAKIATMFSALTAIVILVMVVLIYQNTGTIVSNQAVAVTPTISTAQKAITDPTAAALHKEMIAQYKEIQASLHDIALQVKHLSSPQLEIEK